MNNTVASESPQTSKPPVSERKAAANRANAQRSTGPRTPQGKAASSLNALRHGILAKAAFNLRIEGEERRAEFDALVVGLAQEYQPRTMTEHLTVQQLAGCYWRLAKVWTNEVEGAWRARAGLIMPQEEVAEWCDRDDQMVIIRDRVMRKQMEFFSKEELGTPTIPNGATARTILRYQSAINTMMTRCLAILERRRKERMASGEAFEELDYINEPTATEAPSEASKPETPTGETTDEKSAEPANDAELHKRTQKDAADAPVCSGEEVKSDLEAPAASPLADPNRRETP